MDLKAFCAITGYSREHATRELSRVRRSGELAFETKVRRKRGAKRATWGVIVADPSKLKYDRCSLFYGKDGARLHNYTTLAAGGEKIPPTVLFAEHQPKARGRPRKNERQGGKMKSSGKLSDNPPKPPAAAPAGPVAPTTEQTPKPEVAGKLSVEKSRGCDNPLEEDYFVIQPQDLNGAWRDLAQWRSEEGAAAPPALRRKAFAMQTKLQGCHWDNCKVVFSARTAHNFALRALLDGYDGVRIVSCYEQALFVCHGFAVDQAASIGKIVFFNLSSTVVKAAALLAKDGLSRAGRVAAWLEKKRLRHD